MRKRLLSISLLSCLMLLGAGCSQIANESADTVIGGAVKTPLAALDKAKDLTTEEQARMNREADQYDNLVTVALVVTEGTEMPDEATPGPEFGCSDQIAFMRLSRASATKQVVVDALRTLFAMENETSVKGLYNALAFSDLTVDEVATGDSGLVEVRLSGQVTSGGACDSPRVTAQVEETVRHFHPNFRVWLNGSESEWRCLGDASGLCQ